MSKVFVPRKWKNSTLVFTIDSKQYYEKITGTALQARVSKNKKPYLFKYMGDYKWTQVHRLITDCPDDKFVDHIDGDTLNNCTQNLRVVTVQQNNWNTAPRKNSSSKYKGVSYNKINKNFRARIYKNGKKYELGSFKNEIDAASAYNQKASELFGEYARLNNLTKNMEV